VIKPAPEVPRPVDNLIDIEPQPEKKEEVARPANSGSLLDM